MEVTSDGDGGVHVRELSTVRGKVRARQLAGGVAVQHAAGRDWRLDAHGFWQVHPAAASTLAARRGEVGGGARGRLGLGPLRRGRAVRVGAGRAGRHRRAGSWRSSPARRAVADGEKNLADLPQVSWQAGRVEDVLASAPKPVDVVVLDPPRKGAGKAVVESIVAGAAGPHRVRGVRPGGPGP